MVATVIIFWEWIMKKRIQIWIHSEDHAYHTLCKLPKSLKLNPLFVSDQAFTPSLMDLAI